MRYEAIFYLATSYLKPHPSYLEIPRSFALDAKARSVSPSEAAAATGSLA